MVHSRIQILANAYIKLNKYKLKLILKLKFNLINK